MSTSVANVGESDGGRLRPVCVAPGPCSPALKAVSVSPIGAAALLRKTSVDSRHGHGYNGRWEMEGLNGSNRRPESNVRVAVDHFTAETADDASQNTQLFSLSPAVAPVR